MNVQDQKLEGTIAELLRQLAAANQRIAELEGQIRQLLHERGAMGIMDLVQAKEAAERKLAATTTALVAFENYTRKSTTLTLDEGRKMWFEFVELKDQALAQVEQPQRLPIPPVHPMAGIAAIDRKAQYEEEAAERIQQQLPGEDPDDAPCQCSACAALRARAETKP